MDGRTETDFLGLHADLPGPKWTKMNRETFLGYDTNQNNSGVLEPFTEVHTQKKKYSNGDESNR